MKRMASLLMVPLAAALVMGLSGCAGKKVERIDVNTTVDLSGSWNDSDSRMVAEEMITDSLSFPWINDFADKKGRKPVVVAYGVKNRTSEHINTQTFMKDLERAFVKSGRVGVVANVEERLAIRGERSDQQSGFTANPAAFGKETGADFVLTGTINSQSDRVDREEVVFYQTDLELISVETNEKVWIGDKKIKKMISRSKLGR